MRFVANRLDEVQNRRIAIERNWLVLLPQHIDQLLALGYRGQRLIDNAERLERVRSRVKLSDTGMYTNQNLSFARATGDMIKKNPDKIRAILAGRREAVKFIYQHTADASKILEPIYAPLPPKDVDTLMQMLVDAKFYSEGQIEMPLLVNTVKAMKYVGMIDKDPDLSKMIDASFLPSDLQQVK